MLHISVSNLSLFLKDLLPILLKLSVLVSISTLAFIIYPSINFGFSLLFFPSISMCKLGLITSVFPLSSYNI